MKSGAQLFFAAGLLVALLLLLLIWRERDRLVAARDRIHAAVAAATTLQAETAQQQKAVEAFLSAEMAGPPPPPALLAALNGTAPPAPKRASGRPWLSRLFAENPNLHRLYLEAYRSGVEFDHASSFSQAGLTAEQRVAVVAILARDMERRTDIAAAARAGQLPSNDTSVLTLEAQRAREHEAALRQALGERYASWRLLGRPMLPVVAEAVMQLHRTSTPLTSLQAEELDDLLWRHFPASAPSEVERLLVPGQNEIVRALLERQAAQKELRKSLLRLP